MANILNKTVGPIGFGMMGLSWRPEPVPTDQAIVTMKAAFEAGCKLWNGAEFYNKDQYNTMTILRAYFDKYPEDASQIVVIIKGGMDIVTIRPTGSVEAIRKSAGNILQQLGDIKGLTTVFGIGRRDHSAPFEETLRVLNDEFVGPGKFAGVSLSECSPATIEDAAKLIKVQAVEVELSMLTPDVLKNGVAAACFRHGIPIVAYSPNGRGLLTGQFKSASDAQHLGIVSRFPRLQQEAIEQNLQLTAQIQILAEQKGCTSAQLATNWVRALSKRSSSPTIIPIPGSTTVARAQENSKIIDLSEEELNKIWDLVDKFEPAGRRYPNNVPMEL